MLVTLSFFVILAFILGFLTSKGIVCVWHIIIVVLLNGLGMAFDAPARQSIIMELVGKKYLMNAIALNCAAFNVARIIGPALFLLFVFTLFILTLAPTFVAFVVKVITVFKFLELFGSWFNA